MRVLVWIVFIAAAAYAGYWFAGSNALETAAVRALEQMRSERRASFSSAAVRGFPSRFDLTVEDLSVTNPEGTLTWKAPFVQIFALSYKPNHIIAVWPHEQSLNVSGETVDVASQDMRASVVLDPGTALSLNRTALSSDALMLAGSSGWKASARRINAGTRHAIGEGDAHDLFAEILDLAPDPGLKARLDPEGGLLPERISWLRAEATAHFDQPLARAAFAAGARPALTALDGLDANLRWGDIDLAARGGVTVEPGGLPEGRITLTARPWQPVFDMAVAAGLVRAETAQTWKNALAALAEADGTPDELAVPLVFAHGRMSLGPLPLGPAPRIAPAR